jgi:adenylate kinase
MKKIVLMGAPGSGKGTQAKMIEQKYGLKHVSSGDVLRSEVVRGTELGRQIKVYMDRGEIGPVELITSAVLGYLDEQCRGGFILDGFPRTGYQAEELKKRHSIEKAVLISVTESCVISRITGRLMCSACGAVYHETENPPARAGLCNACGGKLSRRSDDNEETVRTRLRVYHEVTKPVIEFYRTEGILAEIDGEKSSRKVFSDIERIIS